MKSFKEERGRNSHHQTTLKSEIYHQLGCLFLGRPESLGMPFDFYYIAEDREMPHSADYDFEAIRRNIYVNTFRRNLIEALALRFSFLMVCVFMVGMVGIILMSVGFPHFQAH